MDLEECIKWIDLFILDILVLEKLRGREHSFLLMVPTIKVTLWIILLKQKMVIFSLTLLNIPEDSKIMPLMIKVCRLARIIFSKAGIIMEQGLEELWSGKMKLIYILEHLIKKINYMEKVFFKLFRNIEITTRILLRRLLGRRKAWKRNLSLQQWISLWRWLLQRLAPWIWNDLSWNWWRCICWLIQIWFTRWKRINVE